MELAKPNKVAYIAVVEEISLMNLMREGKTVSQHSVSHAYICKQHKWISIKTTANHIQTLLYIK